MGLFYTQNSIIPVLFIHKSLNVSELSHKKMNRYKILAQNISILVKSFF